MTEEMSGGLRHHSDEASGPELCGWIQQSSKQDRYRLEPTSASALRASYATKLLKQSSIYLDIADVVRDVEISPSQSWTLQKAKEKRTLALSPVYDICVEHPALLIR